MFRRELLLLLVLLATLTGAYADNGTLAIANVRNAVRGMTGSLDIVLSGPTTYRDFQFDITLPDGLTYADCSAGTLLSGHSIQTSSQGGNKTRLTGYSDNTLPASGGILLTISFTVSGSATAGDNTVTLANAVFSDDVATHYLLTAGDHTVTVASALTLTDDDTAAPAAANGINVTLSRSFAVDKWYTICLPFALTADKVKGAFGNNVKVGDFNGYTISGSSIRVGFTSVTEMAANHPYIIKVTDAAVNNPTFNSVNIVAGTPMNNKGDDATDENIKAMIGVYAETTLGNNWLYIRDNKFWYSDGSSKVKAYRAYFRFCDFTDAMHSRSIIIDEDGATGIRLMEDAQADGEGWYDLSGRRLSGKPASRGVYIQNGKKVVIK